MNSGGRLGNDACAADDRGEVPVIGVEARVNVAAMPPGEVLPTVSASGASRAGGPGAENRMAAAMGSVANLLSMTPTQLTSAMSAGQSMSTLAQASGISRADLLGAVTSGLRAAAPQGAPTPSDAMLTKIASNIVNHTGQVGSAHRNGRGQISAQAPASPESTVPAAATPAAARTTSAANLDVLL